MNYIRTILISIALLNMHHMHSGQIPNNSDDTIESILSSIPTAELNTQTQEENKLQAWNDHLESLVSNDENWDTATNNPRPDWKTKAFDLAEEVIKQDKSLAETLKTDFINALNKKTTQFIHINNLITEFSTFIDTLLSAPEVASETKESSSTMPIVPEPITPSTPEAVTEPTPAQAETPQTTSSQQGETSTADNSQKDQESAQEQLQQTWKEHLDKIKREGENWVQIDDVLNSTYQAAKELLKLGKIRENTLQEDFRKALEERSVIEKIKPLYHLNIQDTLSFFNNSIGFMLPYQDISSNEQPYYYPEPSSFEPIGPDQQKQGAVAITDERVEKLQKALDEKDATFKAEQKKAEEDRMKTLAAAQEALKKQALTEEQVRRLAEAQNTAADARAKLEKEYEEKRKQDLKEIEKARKSLINYTEQLAAAQKADAEKGMFAAFTQGLSDWWNGTSGQKPGELSSTQQEELLTMMVKDVPHHLQPAAKKTFADFQNTLLNFNKDPFWDNQRSIPTVTWIAQMDTLIKDVVITYALMEPKEIADFVESILQKSGKISSVALPGIMSKIQTKTNHALAEEKRKKEAEQQLVQRRQEKKEQILLAEQRTKAEKDRIEAEKQKRIISAHTYKQEKKQWYDLLNTVAQHKQATPHENHAHLQRALEKSHSLLQLAGDIPSKNKAKLSQKLKQKFSVALLEQQKKNDQSANVYHNMDLFNKEINKMID